jgi:hypothetical protein
VSIIGINTTTQPNALIFSIFPIVFIKSNRLPKELFIFGVVFGFATLFLFISDLSFLSFRDWANYLSMFFVTFAAYNFLRYINGLPYKFFYSVVCIWLFVGLVQMFLYPSFLSFLLHGWRGGGLSNGRGVTGLSTEPTYYGLMLGLFFVIYLINNWYDRSKLLGFLILFQVVFLSWSSTAIIFFLSATGFFLIIMLVRLNVKLILSITALSIVVSVFLVSTIDLYKELRIYKISRVVLDNPEIILATDFSVSERVNHIVFPVVGMVENKFIPSGYGKFDEYLIAKKNSTTYEVFFRHKLFRPSNRILSGHGKVFFELGGIGLLISIGLFFAFKFGFSNPQILFGFILYYLLLFAALPFMTATVPFIVGNILYIRHEKNENRISAAPY